MMRMKQHVMKVAATCYYHLRRLRQIRRRVGREVTTQLVLALIISRLDYCNAALAGLLQTTIAPLQRVQNAAARLVFELGPRKHVTPLSSPTALAACPLAHTVQTVLHYAFSFQPTLPGVFIRHRSDSECQQTASSPTIILIDRLRVTTTSHQVRRARLFVRWSVCMEQTA